MPPSRKILCAVYALIAVAALIATWSQTAAYVHSGPTGFLVNFWQDAKVTASSRNIAADILMFGLAGAVLMVIEARKYGVRFVWLYILGGFFIAVSVTFPLFLIARELGMGASEPLRLHLLDTILLVLLAAGLTGLTIWVDMG
jgi:4-amino-4-deoxy-L-arabinose transferase-like glycosyltransferase